MRSIIAFIMALALCIIVLPSMGGATTSLGDGDDIWIAISPTESHPYLVDRPAAVIPSIDSYRIRVAVYSGIEDYGGDGDFEVTSLNAASARLKAVNSEGDIISVSSKPVAVHKESDDKHTYVFKVGEFNNKLTSDVTRLIFTATETDGTTSHQGSGVVKVTDAAKGSGSGSSGSSGGR